MYLRPLCKRGITATLDNGRLVLRPKALITPKIRRVVSEHVEEVKAELREHEKSLVDQVQEMEPRILEALEAGKLTQDQAEEHLTYLFRLTAAAYSAWEPCGKCQEVLLWRYPGEEDQHPLCYRCIPPDQTNVNYYLAAEGEQ